MIRTLDRAATALIALLPLFLTHGRAPADIDITATAILFLIRSSVLGRAGWAWLRTPWLPIALAWWAWTVLCSTPLTHHLGEGGWRSFGQAVALLRLLIFAAALEFWVLRDPTRRRLLWVMLAVVTAYIAAQSLLQFVTGRNLYGQPRFGDGSLTGPYAHPRAAAPLSRLLFPVLLPVAARLLARGTARARLEAAGIGLGAVLLMVLMGQRMPLLLTGLGLVVVGLLMRAARPGLIALLAVLPLLVAAAAFISPPSFHHLWTVFAFQMEHLPSTPYGLIAARARAMIAANPITGLGFDGYRDQCANPAYFHGWWGGDGRGAWAGVCVQHPHNHYLQAAVQGGIPGLILFSAMVIAWIAAAAAAATRGGPARTPLQVGLVAAIVMQEWPIASASAFSTLPLAGWFFLLLGFGLAVARDHIPAPAQG